MQRDDDASALRDELREARIRLRVAELRVLAAWTFVQLARGSTLPLSVSVTPGGSGAR
jgi:hypothetical protein